MSSQGKVSSDNLGNVHTKIARRAHAHTPTHGVQGQRCSRMSCYFVNVWCCKSFPLSVVETFYRTGKALNLRDTFQPAALTSPSCSVSVCFVVCCTDKVFSEPRYLILVGSFLYFYVVDLTSDTLHSFFCLFSIFDAKREQQ